MKTELASSQRKYHFGAGFPSLQQLNLLTKNTYAMILAGGQQSLLGQLTNGCAKAAVPFGGKFRIIDFVLSNCINSGIRHIGVSAQYRSHTLIQHIKRGWSFLNGHFSEFVDVLPPQQRAGQQHWYLGTADEVYQNLDILRSCKPDFLLILTGDHVYTMDYGKLLAFHVENKADMTMACLEIPASSTAIYDVISINEQSRVMKFTTKSIDTVYEETGIALASMGIYLFNSSFLFKQLLLDAENPLSSHDFAKDLIPQIVDKYRVFAQNFAQSCAGHHNALYWQDISSIDAYWQANIGLTDVTPDLNIYDKEWPIWTRFEQSPPAKFVFDDDGMRGIAVDSLVAGGCIISGARVSRSLLFYDVCVRCFSSIEDSILLPDVQVGQYVTLKKVVVDKHCLLPDGLEVGINPEADRKYFYVSPNGVTLITSEGLARYISAQTQF